jgi:hypothetical protein
MRMIPRAFVGKLAASIAEREGIEDWGILAGLSGHQFRR